MDNFHALFLLWQLIENYARASFVILDKAGHNLEIELKHAFPAGQTGIIRVELLEMDGEVTLCVTDNGVDRAHGPPRADNPGLSLRLVEMLTQQLDGKLTNEEDQGMTIRVTFKK